MIRTERSHLKVNAATHPGMSGKNNEDRYAVSAYRLDAQTNKAAVLAVVSDGVGGHQAGEVAAEIAVETISEFVAESDASQPVRTLYDGIVHASREIHKRSGSDPALQGMGATCASAWVIDRRLYLGAVGDSRIYLIRGNTIRQLTTDHTWVQEAIDHGVLQPEQARDHPNAHVIRRYLGSKQDVVPDFRLRLNPTESDDQAEANQGVHLEPDDTLLICSDGLTDLVDDAEILATLRSKKAEDALDELVNLANQRGGHDNITIVTLVLPEEQNTAEVVPPTKSRSLFVPSCIVISVLVILGTLIFTGYIWMFKRPISTSTPTPSSAPALQVTVSLPSASVPALTITPAPTTDDPMPTSLDTPGTEESLNDRTTTPLLATLTPWFTNTSSP
jgi:serine/threonine protein phosphatase PrpC